MLFVAPVLVLTGCGRGGNMNGTYTFQSVVIDGNTLTTFDAIRGAMLGHFEPQEGSDRNDAIFELSNFISFQIVDEMDEDPAFVELRPVLSSNWRATLTALVVSVTFAVEHEEIPDDWTEFAEELVTRIEDVFCPDEYSYAPEELVGLVERVVLGLFDATTPSETVDEFLKIAPRLQVIGLLPGELSFKIIEGLDDKTGYGAFLEHGEVWTIVDSAVTASVLEDLWIAMILDLNGTLYQTMAGFLAKPIRDMIVYKGYNLPAVCVYKPPFTVAVNPCEAFMKAVRAVVGERDDLVAGLVDKTPLDIPSVSESDSREAVVKGLYFIIIFCQQDLAAHLVDQAVFARVNLDHGDFCAAFYIFTVKRTAIFGHRTCSVD